MLGFFRLHVRHAVDSLRPFLPLWEDNGQDPDAVRWHRRILRSGAVTGGVNSLAWVALILLCIIQEGLKDENDWVVLLMAPAIGIASFVPGTFLGVSAVLACAPAWFLRGPGERWVKFIGTRNLVVARVVCVTAAAGTSLFNAVPLVGIVVRLAVRT